MAHVWFINLVCSRQAPTLRLNQSAPEHCDSFSGEPLTSLQTRGLGANRPPAKAVPHGPFYPQRPRSEPCKMAQRQLRARARTDRQRRMLGARNDGHQMPAVLIRTTHKARKEATSGIWRSPVPKPKTAIRSRQRTTTSTPNTISDRCARNRTGRNRIFCTGRLRRQKLETRHERETADLPYRDEK